MIRKFGNVEGLDPDEPPVKEGFVRIYEFLHGYNDIPEADFIAGENDPSIKILNEEIQKEINREVINAINLKVRSG